MLKRVDWRAFQSAKVASRPVQLKFSFENAAYKKKRADKHGCR